MIEKKMDDVVSLVRALYASPAGASGCCLHIALDDHNLEDDHLDFCLKRAQAAGHAKCERIAGLLLSISEAEREAVADSKRCPSHSR